MKALAPIFFGLCYVLSEHFAYGFACSGTMNSWMMSGNQSPCDIYQLLIRLCIPTFALDTLTYGQQYATGPEACGCNTVAASLVAACSDCQNSATYDGPSYSWYLTANTGGTNRCTSITNGSISTSVSVPASLQVEIPAWAYIDINAVGGFWSYSNAHTVAFDGTLTSTLPTPTNTDTETSSTASVITQTITPTASSTSTSAPIGAIVGGVVGGLAVLVAAVAIILLLMRKKRKKTTEKALLAHRETAAMSYYSQSQSPTTPNYGYVDNTIERTNRPGVLEHNPSSYMTKNVTPDPPGTYVPSSLSPTSRSPTFVASEAPPLTYSPPPLTYSPPPPQQPANTNGYYQAQAPSHQMNQTSGGPAPQATGPPDYRTMYNH